MQASTSTSASFYAFMAFATTMVWLGIRDMKALQETLKSLHSAKHITKLNENNTLCFFKTLGSQTLQELVERIDKAYQRFF
ncbi:hypothetical protein NHP21005_15470 [Helicobacter sp. NHP21005]|nr:hypothetical protein NHP21005_02650 [Helicobacter sp. NHP21005]BEG57005.1 hypothetical protein NHP21005_06930 [Helicobacter sp. NHP21005]BEG57069.1 hypothetical protein NHP21005_07570 [Helicobacter sp. NHP21005]BEG57859.1 hypothetical protein NHP21005_15470 [Helicobacter sp. NHP21005]